MAGPAGPTGPAGMNYQGNWSSSTTYNLNDTVAAPSAWYALATGSPNTINYTQSSNAVALTTGGVALAPLNLPAGVYQVMATLTLINAGSAVANGVGCSLLGPTGYVFNVDLPVSQQIVIPLLAAANLTSATAVQVYCSSPQSGVTVTAVQLAAMQAATWQPGT